MNLPSARSIGLILIGGFVMLVVGALVAPAGAYEGSISDRLAVINTNEGQWQLSKVFDALAVAFASVGMVLLALLNNRSQGAWLNSLGGVCFGAAGIVGLVFVYLLVTDPGPLYDRDAPAPLVVLFIALMAVGVLAFGIHFFRSDYPRWVAVLNVVVGAGVLTGLVAVLVSGAGPETAFGLAAAIYLGILGGGIVLLRHPEIGSSANT